MGLHAGIHAEKEINGLDRVHMKAAQFTNHTKDSDCETLAQRRTIARLCTLFKAYTGKRTWKAIRDRLRRPYYEACPESKNTCIKFLIYKSNTVNELPVHNITFST